MEHPAIHPIGPAHSRRFLKGLAPGKRFTHLPHEGLDLIRMNTGSPFPSQQLLQPLPCEDEPLPIKEIEVSVGSRRVNQRGRQVYDLTKTQALIIDGTVLVVSHGAHGTTPRSCSARFSIGSVRRGRAESWPPDL